MCKANDKMVKPAKERMELKELQDELQAEIDRVIDQIKASICFGGCFLQQ